MKTTTIMMKKMTMTMTMIFNELPHWALGANLSRACKLIAPARTGERSLKVRASAPSQGRVELASDYTPARGSFYYY